MNEASVAVLAQRAARLERQNRHLRLGGLVMVALLTGLIALAAVPGLEYFKSVEAERILVLDETGKVRGGLWVDKDGASTLALSDQNGVVRATLRVPVTGPRLDLCSPKGTPQASLIVDSAGPALELRNEEGMLVFRAP